MFSFIALFCTRIPNQLMRRFLSERTLVVVLFVAAMTIFAFAQQDANKIEKNYMSPGMSALPLTPSQQPSASIEISNTPKEPVVTELPR
jgi:hypothetical protein